ncbi:MAG: TIGR03617 family F420-dependent LLM class oxidoreductase [Myxococcales bacterium]|nr:TIGR03617 family F420-dependent LLM class oxidoreductase [Myxococcales bacterium]
MRVETGLPLDDWRAVADAARAAEAAGFDGLASFDISNDPFVPLAFAAVATERIGLGTGIVVAFPRSPMVVALTSIDLHRESRGRFHLGLGSQVKGHNVRRFGVPWSAPVPRLREYVESLRAIWRCWEREEPLRYEGDHYRFTLMTPEFAPPPTGLPPIPVSIAAVGPAMMKLAGRICDGVRLHGFATRKYLEEVALPKVEEGLRENPRARSQFDVWGGGFIVTGADEAELQKALDATRYRIAFYGSTRSYHGVLAIHGWEELGLELHAMSKRGRWQEMAARVPDEVVRTFAAVGTHDEITRAIEERFGGLSDSVALGFGAGTDPGLVREIVQDVRRIPAAFEGYSRDW